MPGAPSTWTENSAGLRIPAADIEQLVSDRVHRWLLDPGSIYKSTSAWLPDASTQQRLVARAADIGRHWPELPMPRKRAVLTALIERTALTSAWCFFAAVLSGVIYLAVSRSESSRTQLAARPAFGPPVKR